MVKVEEPMKAAAESSAALQRVMVQDVIVKELPWETQMAPP
jgi:hypothetical protein